MKTKYSVKPNFCAEPFTRTTERTYTHLVIGRSRGQWDWGVYSWCGSLALAEKRLKTLEGKRVSNPYYGNTVGGYAIICVEDGFAPKIISYDAL